MISPGSFSKEEISEFSILEQADFQSDGLSDRMKRDRSNSWSCRDAKVFQVVSIEWCKKAVASMISWNHGVLLDHIRHVFESRLPTATAFELLKLKTIGAETPPHNLQGARDIWL